MGRKQQNINDSFKHKEAIALMLRAERAKRGLSGREMADFLGVPRPTYPKYETGRSFPAYKHLTSILLKLNKKIAFNDVKLSDTNEYLDDQTLFVGQANGMGVAYKRLTQ